MVDLIQVTLPDGSRKEALRGTLIRDFVRESIGPGLAKAAIFAKLREQEVDLSHPLTEDVSLQIFTQKSPEALEVARHDAAHVVASAVQRLYPGTQVTIGPTIDGGFYYDFYREKPFIPDELAAIEAEANKEIAQDLPFVRTEVAVDDAIKLFEGKGESFKVEIVKDIVARGAKTLTLYSHGDWVDFCLGPHGPSTGKVGVIKILSSSGAYWRGDHRNPMLQRIYGTAFFDKKSLDAYLHQQEEAKKRDHRKLGKELELFHFHPFAPGSAFWTPKGTALYQTLSQYMRKLALERGYVEIKTPLLFNKGLWEISGHWGKFKEEMFLVLDSESGEHDFSLKPMNCPSHHLYFGFTKHSYRDLPLRLHTQDVLHRNEASGTLGGLTRVRQFAQDDAHIYCTEDQVTGEVKRFVEFLDHVYNAMGLSYLVKFSTRPEKRLGDDELWDRAEGSLRAALEELKLPYELCPGDGAFYGPKIDFHVSDSIGRTWQLGTMQYDPVAAERFELSYVGEDNAEHKPIVLHRAIYGSFERFVGLLIEHFAGAFPLWLAPIQISIVTVADRQMDYARQVRDELKSAGYRVELDERSASMNARIREYQMQKIPLTLVIGDREVEQGGVSPRRYGGEDLKFMTREQLRALLDKEAAWP